MLEGFELRRDFDDLGRARREFEGALHIVDLDDGRRRGFSMSN